MSSKYSFELWSADGRRLADLSGRAKNRRLTKSRNEADVISWTVDLQEFERYCRRQKVDPATLLVVGQTEVRIRRLGTYLSGGQLDYFNPSIDANSQTIEIRAAGFLDLFKDRYTAATRDFTATEATTIASTLLTEDQARGPAYDFGVTIDGHPATVGPHDRSYAYANIKEALQDLTKLQTNPFDFEFTYDKVFKTYASMGNQRADIIFEYPNNIVSLTAPVDGTSMANRVIALGQGLGQQAQAQYIAESPESQATVKVREDVLITNAEDNSDGGLTNAANTTIAARAFPFQIPTLVVNGNVAPFITDYGIGDYVKVKLGGSDLLKHIAGMFRLEKFDLDVDDDDNETINLYLSA